MNNARDELLKTLFEKFLGAPRVVEKVVRFRDTEDGVVAKEATVTGLHNGILRTSHVVERGVLSCGCVAKTATRCDIIDDTFPQPHLVCENCGFTCASCHRGRCMHHGEDIDGELTCKECADKKRPFLFFKNLFGSLGGLLE